MVCVCIVVPDIMMFHEGPKGAEFYICMVAFDIMVFYDGPKGGEFYICIEALDIMVFHEVPNGGWVLYVYGSTWYYGVSWGSQWGMSAIFV